MQQNCLEFIATVFYTQVAPGGKKKGQQNQITKQSVEGLLTRGTILCKHELVVSHWVEFSTEVIGGIAVVTHLRCPLSAPCGRLLRGDGESGGWWGSQLDPVWPSKAPSLTSFLVLSSTLTGRWGSSSPRAPCTAPAVIVAWRQTPQMLFSRHLSPSALWAPCTSFVMLLELPSIC